MRPIPSIPFHPLAELFPAVSEEALVELTEDIRINGLREPILVHEGKVLDGRTRYRVLQILVGRAAARGRGWGRFEGTCLSDSDLVPSARVPHYRAFDPAELGDPLAYVISRNLHRRHLNDDQRRMVAARIANLGKGRPSQNTPNGGISQARARELLAVDERGLERAKVVLTRGSEALKAAVDTGVMTVRMAADVATLPAGDQRAIVAGAPDRKAVRARMKGHRPPALPRKAMKGGAADKPAGTIDDRAVRPTVEAGTVAAGAIGRRFEIILIGPGWSTRRGVGQAGLAAVGPDGDGGRNTIARPPGLYADASLVLLPATAAGLAEARLALAAAGCTHKGEIALPASAWAEAGAGETRAQDGLLLIGTRGAVPASSCAALPGSDGAAACVVPDGIDGLATWIKQAIATFLCTTLTRDPAPRLQDAPDDGPTPQDGRQGRDDVEDDVEAHEGPETPIRARDATGDGTPAGVAPAAITVAEDGTVYDAATGEIFEPDEAVAGAPTGGAAPEADASADKIGTGRDALTASTASAAARPVSTSPPTADDLEIPDFLRAGDPANAWAKRHRKEGG